MATQNKTRKKLPLVYYDRRNSGNTVDRSTDLIFWILVEKRIYKNSREMMYIHNNFIL